jgi:tripartite-type tricarboxylate transporter receptor subunit TctC
MRNAIARLAAVMVMCMFCTAVGAQAYPSKPVRVVVAFSAGGAVDLVARIAGQKLTEMLGQSFVVDYKLGANGLIGGAFVAKSAPDGYTLLVFSSGHTINPSTQKSMPYDTLRDLAAVSPIARGDIVLMASTKLQVNNLKELVALAKANPGKLTYASSGIGGSVHLGGELLKLVTGTDIVHVPYKGAAPMLQDIVAGTADMGFVGVPPAVPLIKAGKARLIAVAGLKRSPYFPDTLTIEESGYPKFEVTTGYGFLAAAATPQTAISRLNGALEKILATADMKQGLNGMGLDPWWSTPDQLQAWLVDEVDKWQKVTRAIHYEPE